MCVCVCVSVCLCACTSAKREKKCVCEQLNAFPFPPAGQDTCGEAEWMRWQTEEVTSSKARAGSRGGSD